MQPISRQSSFTISNNTPLVFKPGEANSLVETHHESIVLSDEAKKQIVAKSLDKLKTKRCSEEEASSFLLELFKLFNADVNMALDCVPFFKFFQKNRASWLLGHEISHPVLRGMRQWCTVFTAYASCTDKRSFVLSRYYLNYLLATSSHPELQKALIISYMQNESNKLLYAALLINWFFDHPEKIFKNFEYFEGAYLHVVSHLCSKDKIDRTELTPVVNKILKMYSSFIPSDPNDCDKYLPKLQAFTRVECLMKIGDFAECMAVIDKLKTFYENYSFSQSQQIGLRLFCLINHFFQRANAEEIVNPETTAFAVKMVKYLLPLREEVEVCVGSCDNENNPFQIVFKEATIRCIQHVKNILDLDGKSKTKKTRAAKGKKRNPTLQQQTFEQNILNFLFASGEDTNTNLLGLAVLNSLKIPKKIKNLYDAHLEKIAPQIVDTFSEFYAFGYFFVDFYRGNKKVANYTTISEAEEIINCSNLDYYRYEKIEHYSSRLEQALKYIKVSKSLVNIRRELFGVCLNLVGLLNHVDGCKKEILPNLIMEISDLLDEDYKRIFFKTFINHFNNKQPTSLHVFAGALLGCGFVDADIQKLQSFFVDFFMTYEKKALENSTDSQTENRLHEFMDLLLSRCIPKKNQVIESIRETLIVAFYSIDKCFNKYFVQQDPKWLIHIQNRMNSLLQIYENCFDQSQCAEQFAMDTNCIFRVIKNVEFESISSSFLLNRFFKLFTRLKHPEKFKHFGNLVIQNYVVHHQPITDKDIDFILKCIHEGLFSSDKKIIASSGLPAILLNKLKKDKRSQKKIRAILEYFLSEHPLLVKCIKGENIGYEIWINEKKALLNQKIQKYQSSLKTAASNFSHPYEAQKISLHNGCQQLKIDEIERILQLFHSQENVLKTLNDQSLENKWSELYSGIKKVKDEATRSLDANILKLKQKKAAEENLDNVIAHMQETVVSTFSSLALLDEQCQKNIEEIHASAIAHLYSQDIEDFKLDEWASRLNQVVQATFHSVSIFAKLLHAQQIENEQLKSEITGLRRQNQHLEKTERKSQRVTKKLTNKITWLEAQLTNKEQPLQEQPLDLAPTPKVITLSIEDCLTQLKNKRLIKAFDNFSKNQEKNELAQLLDEAGFVEAVALKSKPGTSHKQVRFKTKEGHNLAGTCTTISGHKEYLCPKGIAHSLKCLGIALNYQVQELKKIS